MFESGIVAFLWLIMRILVAVYVCVLILVVIFQARLLYFPERRLIATPGEVDLPFEEVHFWTQDGVILSGWFIEAEKPRGVVLFCHGNAGNISHRLDSIAIFHRLGLSTFIFDYRGYGESQGSISEEGAYQDVEAAWSYLVKIRETAPDEIIVFGRSLGGAVASHLAKNHNPKGLIIESSFTSVPDLAADLYPFIPVRFLLRIKYETVKNLKFVNCPVLIVHSRDDDIIPFTHGRRLFDAAMPPKEFLEISGSHNEGFVASGRYYVAGLNAFIAKLVGEL